ncbi:hypothetical protein GCM10027051_00880 [Niabella terrae]
MKLSEMKAGDWVVINDEGVQREGTVISVSNEDHKVQVNNGIQDFWYEADQLAPLELNEAQLFKLGFERMESEQGAKYGKGPFRVISPSSSDFSTVEAWYREDRRYFDHPISVHHLQNIYLQMTKVQLQA